MFSSNKIILLLIVASLVPQGLSIFKSRHFYTPSEDFDIYAQTEYWFTNQPIDHFNPSDNRVFSQRYWVNSTYYNSNNGRIMLYICPEAACSGIPDFYFMSVAQMNHALVVALEHRYYGLSVPFGNESLTVTNLGYLSVEQALADLANFVTWFTENNEYTSNREVTWICVGGSYAGGLSSWLRESYPNVITASWASSPVINSILDFSVFDYQVFLSTNKSGPQCPQAIQNLTSYIEGNLYDNGNEWAQEFKTINKRTIFVVYCRLFDDAGPVWSKNSSL
jgi:hypothetical protein